MQIVRPVEERPIRGAVTATRCSPLSVRRCRPVFSQRVVVARDADVRSRTTSREREIVPCSRLGFHFPARRVKAAVTYALTSLLNPGHRVQGQEVKGDFYLPA